MVREGWAQGGLLGRGSELRELGQRDQAQEGRHSQKGVLRNDAGR